MTYMLEISEHERLMLLHILSQYVNKLTRLSPVPDELFCELVRLGQMETPQQEARRAAQERW